MNFKTLKIIIFVLFLLSISALTKAQLFDADLILGISGNQIEGDTQKGYHKLGVEAGISLTTSLSAKKNFIIQVLYTQKGAVSNIKLSDNTSFQEFKSNLHYLELPLLLEFNSDKKLSYAAGIAPSYLIKAKLYSLDSEISEDLYEMKKYNANFLLQTSYKFNDRMAVNLAFEYSLSSIRNDDYWMTNSILIALHYQLTKK